MNSAPVLVTGAAGFIGYHLSLRLLQQGVPVVGIDNLNHYYDPALKHARLAELSHFSSFQFTRMDIADPAALMALFAEHRFQRVVHLAAQAGVRYSIDHPEAYVSSNLVGFANILEACRHSKVAHLVYASSSSVYGNSRERELAENQRTDSPVSLYAATKKSNELMAHSYAKLFGLPLTGLRFFTVYGPKGRPDMAYFKFSDAIVNGRSIDVYNHGDLYRDFTYIDDIVDGILGVLNRPPTAEIPYAVFNMGNNTPVKLSRFIEILESLLKRTAIKNMRPMQPGDVYYTCANVDNLSAAIGYQPNTPIETGLARFVRWYCDYQGLDQDRRPADVPWAAQPCAV